MRNKFDMQLETLKEQLIQMGNLCEVAIIDATSALKEGSEEKAKEVIYVRDDIRSLRRDIERLCLKLLLQQQPVARDLREISTALQMITDMERIGEQAGDISEIIISEKRAEAVDIPKIVQMSRETSKMVKDSVEAYVRKDKDLAYSVITYDDVVDDLFLDIREKLVAFIAENKGHQGEKTIDLIMVAKYLERIADHAVNIAKWVGFSITGERED